MKSEPLPMEQLKSVNSNRIRKGSAVYSKGQQRVTQILNAARRILIDEGYASLTLRNICDQAAISMGTLHYYFNRKGDILHALVEETIRDYDERIDQILGTVSGDPYKRLDAFLDFLVADIRNRQTRRFFIQLYAIAIHEPEIDKYRAKFQLFGIERIVSLIRELPENQKVAEIEIKQRASGINAMLDGLMVLMGSDPRNIPNISKYLKAFRQHSRCIAVLKNSRADS